MLKPPYLLIQPAYRTELKKYSRTKFNEQHENNNTYCVRHVSLLFGLNFIWVISFRVTLSQLVIDYRFQPAQVLPEQFVQLRLDVWPRQVNRLVFVQCKYESEFCHHYPPRENQTWVSVISQQQPSVSPACVRDTHRLSYSIQSKSHIPETL